jgi:hypothetical protein
MVCAQSHIPTDVTDGSGATGIENTLSESIHLKS